MTCENIHYIKLGVHLLRIILSEENSNKESENIENLNSAYLIEFLWQKQIISILENIISQTDDLQIIVNLIINYCLV